MRPVRQLQKLPTHRRPVDLAFVAQHTAADGLLDDFRIHTLETKSHEKQHAAGIGQQHLIRATLQFGYIRKAEAFTCEVGVGEYLDRKGA
jgi:hypothetical protein